MTYRHDHFSLSVNFLALLLGLCLALLSASSRASSYCLELPTAGAFVQSGVGLSGWACAAQRIEFSIDGGALHSPTAPTGPTRPPAATATTVSVCPELEQFRRRRPTCEPADGVASADVNFTVTSPGSGYLTGLVAITPCATFPPPATPGTSSAGPSWRGSPRVRRSRDPTNASPPAHPRKRCWNRRPARTKAGSS